MRFVLSILTSELLRAQVNVPPYYTLVPVPEALGCLSLVTPAPLSMVQTHLDYRTLSMVLQGKTQSLHLAMVGSMISVGHFSLSFSVSDFVSLFLCT